MNTNTGLDRRAAAWLADGPTELADRVLDAALREVHLTKQRRAPRVPWRFPLMPALTRTTSLAAVALVAAVGIGGLMYVNSTGPGGPGGRTEPPVTQRPTAVPTAAATLHPGIPGWTKYTSTVYGLTMSYPSDWSVYAPATVKWPAGRDLPDGAPYAETFVSPGDEIGVWVWQVPLPAGADFSSEERASSAVVAVCESMGYESCEPAFAPKKVCAGESCLAAYVAMIGDRDSEIPHALVPNPKSGTVTVFLMGREDEYPAAKIYGGTVALLKAIVAQVVVQ